MSGAAADTHGRSRPDACSVLWDDAGGSALGTAPAAMFFVALEQNGPWGPQAATQSHLDPGLGATVDRMCQEAGGRFILIRRPGLHPDLLAGSAATDRPQRFYLAVGLAGVPNAAADAGLIRRPWLLQADLDDPARLARLALLTGDCLSRGDIDAIRATLPELEPSPGPVLMICTNSRRDICCSVRGRPVAMDSASARPGRVWECSHTGGHRFAPTGVLLPHGQVLGRLSATSAVAALDAAMRGELPAELLGGTYDRGRSHLSAPAQAAESVIRQQIMEPGLLALVTTATTRPGRQDAWNCRVSHVDGRAWNVIAVRGPAGDALPESCGKEPVPRWQWSVVSELAQ